MNARPAAGPRRAVGGTSTRLLRLAIAFALAGLAGCSPQQQPARELLIPINPLCTTCNDFIRCDAAAQPGEPVQGPDYQIFHLRPKTMLAQMATIFDFLLQHLREREEDRRPLAVYSARRRGLEPSAGAEAVTDLRRDRINVPDGWIDQATGAWHGADGALRGQCRLLPVAEGRELVERLRRPADTARGRAAPVVAPTPEENA
jgi:hypothetical protein